MADALSFPNFPFPQTDHVLGSTRMLKDFLQENTGIAISKSRAASFKALAIRAVKRISFRAVKARRILPRSLSRRLLGKRERDERESGGDFVVKIRDIVRWKSFRDSADKTAALDFADSPDCYTAAATTTTTTTATSSKSSSWCESDFTAEDSPSPSWMGCSDNGGDGDGEVGGKYFPCVGEDSTEAHAEDDKKEEALSRYSDEEEEENLLKEKARLLLEDVEAPISFSESCRTAERRSDRLFLEIFRRELTDSGESEADEGNGDEEDCKWRLLLKGKEAYVREMEREGKWGAFGDEEKVELGLEIEGAIFGSLVDELLFHIFQF